MSAAANLVRSPELEQPVQAAPSKGELMHEHLIWLRHCARSQQRVSASVAQMAARIEALEAEVLRLRAQAVRSRSAALWGVGGWGSAPYEQAPRPAQPGQRAASAAAAGAAGAAGSAAKPVARATASRAPRGAADAALQRAAAALWPQADELLCQTGCASQAHHWLQDDGQCQRKGVECERVPAEGGVSLARG